MYRRFASAVKYATKNESFLTVLSAGVFLIIIGTITYSLTQGWNIADAFYFAICTLTTSSVMDPKLTITGAPIKIFTVFYILTGIGIIVEMIRQIGFGYLQVRAAEKKPKQSKLKN